MHFFKHFKDIKITMKNNGEELVITAKGPKDSIANLEKKLGVMKELCHDCCCDEKDKCC
jgi:hypothetical protein